MAIPCSTASIRIRRVDRLAPGVAAADKTTDRSLGIFGQRPKLTIPHPAPIEEQNSERASSDVFEGTLHGPVRSTDRAPGSGLKGYGKALPIGGPEAGPFPPEIRTTAHLE